MIPIQRGDEPDDLPDIREEELKRVRLIAATRSPASEEIGVKYRSVKQTLWERQGYKCAFCETREQLARNDVEHFRPKSSADRRPGCPERYGYWWLAWTWSNLLFACRNCNQAPAKLDKFPLDAGSEALVAEQAPPGKERPLLLDPAEEDGIAHIQFKPSNAHGVEEWIPTPRNGSMRGLRTIEVCRLDRPDLITLYTEHVERHVKPEVGVVETAIAGGDLAEIWEAWNAALLRLLSRGQPYVGLSWDALDHLVPVDVRVQWNLSLRLPWSR